jgi:hypothetical protein
MRLAADRARAWCRPSALNLFSENPEYRSVHGARTFAQQDWAGKTLPTLQHHLEMAQEMDKNRK